MRVWIVLGVCALFGCGSRTELIVDDAAPDSATSDSFVPVDSGVDAFDAPPPLDTDVDADVPTPTICPHDVPSNGATCPVVGAVCTYTSVEIGPCGKGVWQTAARCERDGWLDVAHCVDFSACPTLPPTEGEACASLGLDCFYTSPATCDPSSVAQCTGSGWRWVNDCGKRTLGAQPCTLATAFSSAQTLLQGSGTIADRAALHAVGTQIVTSYVLTPELGGAESIDRARFQSAVPSMIAPITFSPFGPYRGDVAATISYAHERLGIAWGSAEASLAGAFVAVGDFDATTPAGATRLDSRRTERAELALTTSSVGDTTTTAGWVVFRHELTPGDTDFGATAIPIDALGNPRSGLQSLVKERFDPPVPLVAPIHHAWATTDARDGVIVIAAPQPATGDLVDDTGVVVWFLDTAATSLPSKGARVLAGQTLAGSIALLSDGSAVLAFVPEATDPRAPFHVVKVTRDGTITDLPAPARTSEDVEPHVAAFDDGFVLAWAGATETDPDFFPAVVNVSLRDASGNPTTPSPVQLAAPNLDIAKPISITVSPTDRAMSVAWTVQGSTGKISVGLQRSICERR